MPDQIGMVHADFSASVEAVISAVEESIRSAAVNGGGGPDALDVAFLAKYEKPRLVECFGEFMAERLAAFASLVDGTHPCFVNLANDKGESVRHFGTVMSEMVSAMDAVRDKPTAAATLRKGFLQHKEFKGIRNLIASPPVRAIRSPEGRDQARRKKSVKRCPTKQGKYEDVRLADCPSNFLPLVRGGKDAGGDEGSGIAIEDFRKIGCGSIASRFGKRQRIIQKMLEEKYLGFVRVRMALAGMISARSHGCYDYDGTGNLAWPMPNFEDRPFWIRSNRHYDCIVHGEAKKAIDSRRVNSGQYVHRNHILCEVRAYPLHAWPTPLPERAGKVVAALEEFPELGGRAAFDHYWIVVPSVETSSQNMIFGSLAAYCDGETMHAYPTAAEMQAALDAHLVSAGLVRPAVLGESDGKCHFITII